MTAMTDTMIRLFAEARAEGWTPSALLTVARRRLARAQGKRVRPATGQTVQLYEDGLARLEQLGPEASERRFDHAATMALLSWVKRFEEELVATTTPAPADDEPPAVPQPFNREGIMDKELEHAHALAAAGKVPPQLLEMLAGALGEAITHGHSVDQFHAKVVEVRGCFASVQRLVTWAREHPAAADRVVRALDRNPGGMGMVYMPPIPPLPSPQCVASSIVEESQDR